jgi:hypothetical protein
MLNQLKVPVAGVVQNMKEKDFSVKKQIKKFAVPFLGEINFDSNLEAAIGSPLKLAGTRFAKDVKQLNLI